MSQTLKETLRLHLQKSYSAQDLKQWFDPLRLELSEEEKRLSVGFPHSFFAKWFSDSIQDRFEQELHQFLGTGYVLHYGHSSNTQAEAHAQDNDGKSIDFPFGHQFTFESFLTNKKNFFPLTTAREVAKQKDIIFNPFIVSGEAGSGKTHLLKAVANEVCKKFNPERVFFGNMEDLYNLYHGHFGGDAFAARKHICKFRFLFVDEFQQIRKYNNFQSELITLFNHFYDHKQQMVFCCSDKLPSYEFLDPKLKSRLEWGLIVNLKRPDLDIRVRTIEQYCRVKTISLTREQVLTLAQRFTDLRFLQGILLKFYAYKEFVNKAFTDNDFEQILSQTAGTAKKHIRPDVIMDTICEHFEVERKDLVGSRRHHQVVQARQVAMYLCRELIGSSYPALGRMFGNRDHSTALYAVKKINKLQSTNSEMKNLLSVLKKKCLSKA
ncbi:MAG: ATP-binding protein [Proteobacteria bacterium]|nr:ATP-binding protein [Pseudomonadota bacterium]